MGLKVQLGRNDIPPMESELYEGVKFWFSRRLTRQEAVDLLKRTSKDALAAEVPDLKRFFNKIVTAMEGVGVQDESGKQWGPEKVTHRKLIVDFLLDPGCPQDLFDEIMDHLEPENRLGENEGNS